MGKNEIREPIWPALAAMVADAFVFWGLPSEFAFGPRWLLLAIIFVLLIPIVFSYHRGRHDVARVLTFIATGAITLAMISSLVLLVTGLPKHKTPPGTLLISAGALWITNVLVFAIWYWKLDGGGPLRRGLAKGNVDSSFLFPQMLVGRDGKAAAGWSPQFVDYLFLSFNTSTAFSPTDTAVLSRGAKLGMMVQAIISLSIVVLLAARAVNIL